MIDQKTFAKYAASPSAFRADLLVDVDGVARRFGDVMDDWQRKDFKALDLSLKRCAGRSRKVPIRSKGSKVKMRAYLERSRGHSKTNDIAATVCWALAFAARPLKGYCYAADRDQANLLVDAIQTLIRLNPWLADILSIQAHKVINKADGHPGKGSKLTIESSDVGSSYGILADFLICEELTNWPGDGGLWDSLISSAAKRKGCLLIVISNAGFIDSWQWKIREAARTDPSWIFSRLNGPRASWITQDRLDEQKRMLPTIAYNRLWENQWSSGAGDAILPSDIAAAFVDGLEPMTGRGQNWLFVGGLDLGLTRDCSAFVVLAVPSGGKAGRIRLAHHKLWRPPRGGKINLMEVERHVLELDERFGLEVIAFDPWQAESMAQRLEVDSGHRQRNQRRRWYNRPWMKEIPPTGANLREQATLVIESFNDHRLQFYDCVPLRRDLDHLRAEEKSYGFRLTSPRDETGHGDTFSAFALALLVAHELAAKKTIRAGVVTETHPGKSPMLITEARQEEYQREMQPSGYDHQAEFREAMQRTGRVQSPF